MSFSKQFRVETGAVMDLDRHDADFEPAGLRRSDAKEAFENLTRELSDLQYLLYAENRHSLLVVLQGRDAAGKDGTIRHVFGPLNPQGCRVTNFKVPSKIELAHDFLWRCHAVAPERG
jgi:polyphosphate kinase 2 (PPK2 family)